MKFQIIYLIKKIIEILSKDFIMKNGLLTGIRKNIFDATYQVISTTWNKNYSEDFDIISCNPHAFNLFNLNG